jgi:hypothetical protein
MKWLAVLGLAVLSGCDGSLEAPLPAPARHRIASGALQLVGRGDTACSQPPAGGDIWCAFARLGPGNLSAEIWAVNVTRAMAQNVSCDSPGPFCKLLTSTAWTHVPLFASAFPAIDEFAGETLFVYGNTAAPSGMSGDPFVGPISAWRPGWAEPRRISSDRAYACGGPPGGAVAYCLDNVVQGKRNTEFDLLAGPLSPSAAGPLPSVGRLSALGSNGQVMWGVGFSPGGEDLGFSSPSADGTTEVLRTIKTAEVGRGMPTELLSSAARWQLGSDGRKVYYLKDFNYADRNDHPAGALTVIDFPGGGGAQTLQKGVGDFVALGQPGQAAQALGFLQDMFGGFGTLRLLRDLAHPEQAATVDTEVEDFTISPDLRYGYVYKPAGASGPESLVVRTDGATRCRLATRPGGLPYLVTFIDSAPVVLFIEDDANGIAQGWYTNPESCDEKHNFAGNMALLVPIRGGILYGEQDPTGRTMSLKVAAIAGDGTLPGDGGTLLEAAVDPQLAIAGGRSIVYTISDFGDAASQGLYVYGPLP